MANPFLNALSNILASFGKVVSSAASKLSSAMGTAGGYVPPRPPPKPNATYQGMPVQPGTPGYQNWLNTAAGRRWQNQQTQYQQALLRGPTTTQKLTGAFNLGSAGASYLTSGNAQSMINQGQRTVRLGRRMAQRGKRGGYRTAAKGAIKQAYGYGVAGGQNVAAGQDVKGFGNLLGAGGSLLGAIPGIGEPIESVVKFGKTVLDSIDKLQKWTGQLHEANMQFAEFSASMGLVQAQQQMRDIQYLRERGEIRAKNADELAQAHSRLRDNLAPAGDIASGIYNRIGTGLSNAVNEGLERSGIARGLREIRDWLFDRDDKDEDKPIDAGQFYDRLANESFVNTYGRPSRFNQNPFQNRGPGIE